MNEGTIIVGAGEAGLQLATSLRGLGDTHPITIVGEEPAMPYQRPPLSKSFLHTGSVEGMALRHASFFREKNIDVLTSQAIKEVRLTGNQSGRGTAITHTGAELPFARLALTTGAAPRRLSVPGTHLNGICYLRTLDDAEELRSLLQAARSVAVVGGGFVGLEAGATARAMGLPVTVVESSSRLLQRVVAPVFSEFFAAAHQRRGIELRLNASVAAFHGSVGVEAVELSTGEMIAADVVIAGIGAEPRTELARSMGLDCDGGIVVDSFARTSNPAIVAAGDCTSQLNPYRIGEHIRLESVQNAVEQAKVAAASLMQRGSEYEVVPWFWSDQGDLKLQIAGLSAGYDQYAVRGEPEEESFSVLYYREGRLLCADVVNRPQDFVAVRRALGSGGTVPFDRVGDIGGPLKTLIQAGVAV